ncbi:MAG: hypothetical protein IPN38_13570 [Flavobacteriales bacterium]|nr:hypothetical protein [Flavobacteriales bacterium]
MPTIANGPYSSAVYHADRIMEIEHELLRIGYDLRPHTRGNRILYITLGLLAILTWIGLFTAGSWINTTPERTQLLSEGFSWKDFFPVFFCWTPTNAGLLGLLAAFAAGCLSFNFDPTALKARIVDARLHDDEHQVNKLLRRVDYMHEVPWVSMKRGFVVYLMVIGGQYLFDTDPFREMAPEDAQASYVKLAGLISSLSFMVGFDPTRFEELINTLSTKGSGKVASLANRPGTVDEFRSRADLLPTQEEGELEDTALGSAPEHDPFEQPVKPL